MQNLYAEEKCHLSTFDIPSIKPCGIKMRRVAYNFNDKKIDQKVEDNEFLTCAPIGTEPLKNYYILGENGFHKANYIKTNPQKLYDPKRIEAEEHILIEDRYPSEYAETPEKFKDQAYIDSLEQLWQEESKVDFNASLYKIEGGKKFSNPSYLLEDNYNFTNIKKYKKEEEKRITSEEFSKFKAMNPEIIIPKDKKLDIEKFAKNCFIAPFGNQLYLKCRYYYKDKSDKSNKKTDFYRVKFLLNKKYKILYAAGVSYGGSAEIEPFFSFSYKGIDYLVYYTVGPGEIYGYIATSFFHEGKMYNVEITPQCGLLSYEIKYC